MKYENNSQENLKDQALNLINIEQTRKLKDKALKMINGEQINEFNIYNQTKLQDNYKIMKDVDAFMQRKIKQIKYDEYQNAKQIAANNINLVN